MAIAFGMFGAFWLIIAVIGNCFIYCERNKDWYRLTDSDTLTAMKWTYFWPFLLAYWIPRLLWTETRPWVWGGICKFFGNYRVAYRVYRTGK